MKMLMFEIRHAGHFVKGDASWQCGTVIFLSTNSNEFKTGTDSRQNYETKIVHLFSSGWVCDKW